MNVRTSQLDVETVINSPFNSLSQVFKKSRLSLTDRDIFVDLKDVSFNFLPISDI